MQNQGNIRHNIVMKVNDVVSWKIVKMVCLGFCTLNWDKVFLFELTECLMDNHATSPFETLLCMYVTESRLRIAPSSSKVG